jgi:site-specific DNA recombinase
MNRQRIEHNASLAALRIERERNQRWIEKTLDAIQEGLDVKSVKERYNATEGRQREIEALLEQNFDAPVLLHPNMGGRYQAEVQNLLQSLDDEEHRSKSGQILRGLIEKVTLTSDGRNGELAVDLHGDLAGILQNLDRQEENLSL